MSETTFVPVYSAEGKLAADMIRLLLESFGIPVKIEQESAGLAFGLTVGDLGEAIVLVPENQAADARQILIAMERGELEQKDEPEETKPGLNKDSDKLED